MVYTGQRNAIRPMLGTPGAPRHPESIALVTPPTAAAPGSVVSLSYLFEALLVYRQVGDRSPQPRIFCFQRLQALRLVHLHTAIQLAPPIVRLL